MQRGNAILGNCVRFYGSREKTGLLGKYGSLGATGKEKARISVEIGRDSRVNRLIVGNSRV
jgi:hypothetical protein